MDIGRGSGPRLGCVGIGPRSGRLSSVMTDPKGDRLALAL
jgi:hypothetical protein